VGSDEARRRALGIEHARSNTSPYEIELLAMLSTQKLTLIPQKAIGPYNVDIAANSVAVECLGGGWHRTKRHGHRLRYLLNSGWDVLYIWIRPTIGIPLTQHATEDIISFTEFRDRNPTAPSRYRVIRGSGEFITEGNLNSNDIPDIIPFSNRPNTPPDHIAEGFCRCGCGGEVTLNTHNRIERNIRRGEFSRYLPGHNPRN
jgi:very-short-patch-repair endonuclease